MGLRLTRVTGVGTNVAFLIPEGADAAEWFLAQVAAYDDEGPTVPTQTEVAWVLMTAWNLDLLMKPERLTWNAVPPPGSVVVSERTVPPIAGRVLPPTIFRAHTKVTNRNVRHGWDPNYRAPEIRSEAALAIDQERTRMALAQVSILREVVSTAAARARAAGGAYGGRAGGEIFSALIVGSVIIAAIALDEYLTNLADAETLRTESAERIARARIAESGRLYTLRLAQRNSTGTMPPPSELEVAVAGEVQTRATSEWTDFWTGAERTASGIGKGLMVGGALLLAAALVK